MHIHYFQRYAQQENLVTNNTLLLLRRLCDHDPRKLQELLGTIFSEYAVAGSIEQPQPIVGPVFRQQVRGPKRVADGLMEQRGFRLLIETKRGSLFDVQQAIDHLDQLADCGDSYLLLLGGGVVKAEDPSLARLSDALGQRRSIAAAALSFADLIACFRAVVAPHESELDDLLCDFESFCAEQELLPHDRWTMFVPSCRLSLKANLAYSLYYWPAERSEPRAEWLGIYSDKMVHAVGRIAKRVVIDGIEATREIRTQGLTEGEKERVRGACQEAATRGWNIWTDHRFFLCDELQPTQLRKDTPQGVRGHQYLDLRPVLRPSDNELSVQEVATRLAHSTWSLLRPI